jgi:hypothetical protein
MDEYSDYESDLEEAKLPRPPSRSVEELVSSGKRIYSYLKVIDKTVKPLPPLPHSDILTVFIEPEDVLYNTFLCDENVGYIAQPTGKDPDKKLFLASHRLPIMFY